MQLDRKPFQKRFDRNLSDGKFDHKPFQKRLEGKPQQRRGRRDKPAQRFWLNVCSQKRH
jgi:hypothetical protein